jgi:hypothetical protein
MAGHGCPATSSPWDASIVAAANEDRFDFVIVGSGAGGGPVPTTAPAPYGI